MNILFLCDEYPPGKYGGIGISVQTLARALVARGHNVYVAGYYDWGYGGDDFLIDQGVKVYRFRRILSSPFFMRSDSLLVRAAIRLLTMTGIFYWDIKKSLPRYHTFLEELISKHRIDIVEQADYNDYLRFCKGSLAIEKLSVPTVLKLHGSMTVIGAEQGYTIPTHVYETERQLFRNSPYVSSVSRYLADKTAMYFQHVPCIKIMHNGLETTKYADIVKPSRTPTVVFAGSLVAGKGIYQLVKAWNILIEKMPQAKLQVFGKGPIGKIRSLLSREAVDRVVFMGHVQKDEMIHHISAASVVAAPSYFESFGLVAFEALMCKTALVYTKRAAGPEFITDGVNGLLVDPDDVEEIACAITRLLEDGTFNEQIATAGNKLVKADFDIYAIADKHIDYYEHVLHPAHEKKLIAAVPLS